MPRTRTSLAWLFLWGGLVVLAFHPLAPVTRALDVVLAPARWTAELGSPLSLLRSRRVAAAERSLASTARAEAAEGAAVLARMAERALPSDPRLREGRRFLPAEVIERPSKDECWVRLRLPERVARGAPVVCGDAFVGRVVEWRAPGLARVQLLTERGFRVGAQVRDEESAEESEGPIYLTVGGVRVPRPGDPRTVRLAAYQPSSSALASGLARVHELLADAEDATGLAEGFRLGEVWRAGERGECWIEPELDFLDGLFQVAILTPASGAEAPGPAPPTALEDGQWLATQALSLGDPSPWRSTRKIPLGRAALLAPGAAVSGAGAHLVGRVTRVGLTTSDVALLDDAGFSLAVIAQLEGHPEPRVLGRLTTLGRSGEAIRMHWPVRVPLAVEAEGEPPEPTLAVDSGRAAPSGSVRARLFSGSGDPGLPGGLFLGTALLPLGALAGEERELELHPGVAPADVRTLFVRREPPRIGP